jgi:hypothetical protein
MHAAKHRDPFLHAKEEAVNHTGSFINGTSIQVAKLGYY